jgi:hypothetical protein
MGSAEDHGASGEKVSGCAPPRYLNHSRGPRQARTGEAPQGQEEQGGGNGAQQQRTAQ